MKKRGNRTVVIHLSKTGARYYAPYLKEHLEHATWIVSENSDMPLKDAEVRIKTYTSVISALWSTIRHLNGLKRIIDRLIDDGHEKALFPAYHAWNTPIIKALKKKGIPSTLVIHDAHFHLGEKSRLNEKLQWRSIELADRIVALSEFVKRQIINVYPSKKIVVIPHGLVYPDMEPPLRKPTNKPKILMTGRLKLYQGVDLLCRAFNELGTEINAALTVAGKGRVDSGLIGSKIELINKQLSDVEHQSLLIQHDILILPYLEASQSGVIPAGISAAIPMIVTKVGGLTEQLTDEEAVFVEPTVPDLKQGMSTLINDASRYQSIYKALLRKREYLTWHNISMRIQDFMVS